ncbi:protein-L-isoaspartate O-methyltransferase family protein [Brevibacterium renqingii]|uniref:protein-L-isoaspartate O-methyltransferase family protein n=1 Tax=Brevibacterium renqingii TaxID=2776916 RepID=UPI001ADFA6AC|nr:protein-L-isoaspartate O-methyltransferase [Brevibacterium renqingii]
MTTERSRLPVAEAFDSVPRAPFLPATERTLTKCNVPLAIGHGQTNSQPSTVADMLELLDVRLGDRVLDLGAGSGWTTALLSVLVGDEGQVSGVERHQALVDTARTALSHLDCENAEILTARPGQLGLPEAGPFDKILVSAGAEEVPAQLLDQLEIGGIMVIPVNGQMLKVVRDGRGDDEVTITRHGLYRFVPLITE